MSLHELLITFFVISVYYFAIRATTRTLHQFLGLSQVRVPFIYLLWVLCKSQIIISWVACRLIQAPRKSSNSRRVLLVRTVSFRNLHVWLRKESVTDGLTSAMFINIDVCEYLDVKKCLDWLDLMYWGTDWL